MAILIWWQTMGFQTHTPKHLKTRHVSRCTRFPGSNMILYDSLVFYGNGWMGFSWDSIYGVECNITISRFWNHSAKMHDHDIHGSTGCGFTHFSFFIQFGRSIPMYSHWLTNFQGGEATNEPPMLSINIPFCSELCTIHHTHTHTYI